MNNKQRESHHKIISERAIDWFNKAKEYLDPENVNVFVQSENKSIPYIEFKSMAQQYLDPHGQFYRPDVIAYDMMGAIESLFVMLDSAKGRYEESFKSFMTINEEMTLHIDTVEDENKHLLELRKTLEEENLKLRQGIIGAQNEAKIKREGLEPLFALAEIKLKEILSLYDKLKKEIGDEKKMAKFIPAMQDEVESAKRIIKAKLEVMKQTEEEMKKLLEKKSEIHEEEENEKSPDDDEKDEEDIEDDDDDDDSEESEEEKPKKKEKVINGPMKIEIPHKYSQVPDVFIQATTELESRRQYLQATGLYDVELDSMICRILDERGQSPDQLIQR